MRNDRDRPTACRDITGADRRTMIGRRIDYYPMFLPSMS